MNKVIQAELKKTVSKPGIYILAVFLAAIMVLSVFAYKPTTSNENEYQFTGTTVLQIYQNDFGNGVDAGIKAAADLKVTDAKASLDSYYVDSVDYKQKVSDLQNKFNKSFNEYRECGVNPSVTESYINAKKADMIANFKAIYNAINQGLDAHNNNAYPILTTKSNYDKFCEEYNASLKILETKTTKIAEICADYVDNYEQKFNTTISNFYFPTVSEQKVENYTKNVSGNKYAQFEASLNSINNDIETIKNEAQTSADINVNESKIAEIKKLVSRYDAYCDTYANLIKYDLLSNALSIVKTKDKGNLLYLENVTEIDSNAWLIKYQYLFKNNKTMAEYANPLTIGISSNAETNGYDYAYFTLKLFSFIIIAYAIMAGAHTIAGEIKEGTMRYLAIRPVKRTSILFGKFFAIAIMSTILVVFSGIISVLVGGFIYGFNSATILTVFAGKYAITLHPIAMIVIYLLSLILELLVYLSIALMLSTLIKSDILAVTIIMVIYLINILLPMFSYSSIGWLAYYPFSHISLYSLFGSALFANSSNTFNLLLGAKVYSTTGLFVTIITIALIIALCNIVSSYVFKRKEI